MPRSPEENNNFYQIERIVEIAYNKTRISTRTGRERDRLKEVQTFSNRQMHAVKPMTNVKRKCG